MIDKLNIRFHRVLRCAPGSDWYWMFSAGDAVARPAGFPKYGAPEAQGLGPRGTVVAGKPQLRIGQLISHTDVDGKLQIVAIIEGELEPPEREVVFGQIADLLGLDLVPDWAFSIFENSRQSFSTHSRSTSDD